MKTVLVRFAALAALVLLVLPSTVRAQAGDDVRIRRLIDEKWKTPEYQVKRAPQERSREWLKLYVLYETRPEFIDELEFTYYVLMRTKDSREPYVLLKGSITYVNIERGRHQSTMYIHPSVLARYGNYDGMAVEVKMQGRPVAVDATSNQYRKWLEQLSPRDNYVLRAMDTPFAFIGSDNDEMVKPTATP